MIAIRSVFEALYSQKMAEMGEKFSHFSTMSLNLLHKKQILKNS
jgi:hypothetical protein